MAPIYFFTTPAVSVALVFTFAFQRALSLSLLLAVAPLLFVNLSFGAILEHLCVVGWDNGSQVLHADWRLVFYLYFFPWHAHFSFVNFTYPTSVFPQTLFLFIPFQVLVMKTSSYCVYLGQNKLECLLWPTVTMMTWSARFHCLLIPSYWTTGYGMPDG